jgi:hypothetical protein
MKGAEVSRNQKRGAAIMAVGYLGVVAFPLSMLGTVSRPPAQGGDPFSTLVPVAPTITPAIGAVPPLPTLLPTVGPGQVFEESDPNRPEVGEVHGNDEFGWGRIKGKPGLVLIWVTDELGTHYAVVDDQSELFLGTLDEATDSRALDGFDDYIEQRERLVDEIIATGAEGIGSGVAIGVLAWGLGVFPATGGAGCVAGVIGGVAVLVANSVRNFIILQGQKADLRSLDGNLSAAFDQSLAP